MWNLGENFSLLMQEMNIYILENKRVSYPELKTLVIQSWKQKNVDHVRNVYKA